MGAIPSTQSTTKITEIIQNIRGRISIIEKLKIGVQLANKDEFQAIMVRQNSRIYKAL